MQFELDTFSIRFQFTLSVVVVFLKKIYHIILTFNCELDKSYYFSFHCGLSTAIQAFSLFVKNTLVDFTEKIIQCFEECKIRVTQGPY